MFKKTINIKHFLRFNVRPLHCRQRIITSGIWDRGTYKMSFFFSSRLAKISLAILPSQYSILETCS